MGLADRDYMYEPRQVVASPMRVVRRPPRRSLRAFARRLVVFGAWVVIGLGVFAVVLLGGALAVQAIVLG